MHSIMEDTSYACRCFIPKLIEQQYVSELEEYGAIITRAAQIVVTKPQHRPTTKPVVKKRATTTTTPKPPPVQKAKKPLKFKDAPERVFCLRFCGCRNESMQPHQ